VSSAHQKITPKLIRRMVIRRSHELDDGQVSFVHYLSRAISILDSAVNPGFSLPVMRPLQSLKPYCKLLDVILYDLNYICYIAISGNISSPSV
jgi:hypothetical protein